MKNLHRIVAALALALPSTLLAQDAPQPEQEARDALREVLAAYRAIDQYAATSNTTMDVELDGANEAMADAFRGAEEQSTLRFKRPDHVFLRSTNIVIVLNGDTLQMGFPMMMQYSEQEAPEDRDTLWQMIGTLSGGMIPLDPLSLLQADEQEAEQYIADLKQPAMKKVTVDGADRLHISAVMSADAVTMAPSDADIPIEAWIDPERMLITRYTVDITEQMNSMMEEMAETQGGAMLGETRYTKMVMSRTIEQQQTGVAFDDDAFTFDWDDRGYELAEDDMFGGMMGMGESPLLGREAPEITGETLAGQAFTLSDLRGNVVVLDFWATWCGPCVQAIPKIQELHEQFKDQPVRVIGINQDRGNYEQVKKFVEKKEITFPHVKDPRDEIGKAYEVTGIPTTVLIDKQGVVQAVHVGFMPGQEKKLTEQIEALLEGESLVTEQQKEAAKALGGR